MFIRRLSMASCARCLCRKRFVRGRERLFTTHFQSYSINEVEGDLSILLADYPTEKLAAALATAKAEGVALAICQPYANRERQEAVKALMAEHRSTTVDNRAYILFCNNHLPKQQFKL